MPVAVIGNILGRGVFAALVKVRGGPARFRRIWLDNIQRVALLSIPSTIGVVLVAEPLVIGLLGERWRPGVTALQLLALTGVVRTFSSTSGGDLPGPRPAAAPRLHGDRALRPPRARSGRGHAMAETGRGRRGGGACRRCGRCSRAGGDHALAHRGSARAGGAVLRPAAGWACLAVALLAGRQLLGGLPEGLELIALVAVRATVYALTVAAFARDGAVTMWLSLRGAPPSEPPPAAST